MELGNVEVIKRFVASQIFLKLLKNRIPNLILSP